MYIRTLRQLGGSDSFTSTFFTINKHIDSTLHFIVDIKLRYRILKNTLVLGKPSQQIIRDAILFFWCLNFDLHKVFKN